ncbi:MAG: hypothetical protein WBA31_04805 [Candidatus Dormiibacterota bacterium]
MKTSLHRVISTTALAGALTLVGCASNGVNTDRPAGAVLQAANQRALDGSFQVNFSGHLQVDLSAVTPPAGVTAGEMGLIQAAINSAELTGVALVQSPKDVSLTFNLSPLISQSWHVLDLNGSEYISENGSQWHRVTAPSGSSKTNSGDPGQLKADFKSWGLELQKDATVIKLANTSIAGQPVEHLQTTLSGSDLNQGIRGILGQAVGSLGSEGASVQSELPAIEGLLQFSQVKADSYVLTSNGDLDRTVVTSGLTLNLSQLSTLDPGQSGLPSGTAPMTTSMTADFGNYGKNFDLRKPSDIVAGPLPTPTGLGAL